VDVHESLLLEEDSLGLNGELGALYLLDHLTEERTHEAAPFGLVVEVIFVHPLVGDRVVVAVVANSLLAEFTVEGDLGSNGVGFIDDLEGVNSN